MFLSLLISYLLAGEVSESVEEVHVKIHWS
nr:MAG TPA: hypothetical protein [Caudoviricetes sp.]DAM33630.1 MAG TPA: hypothetical protein [Caudoviricetes sp.]DAX80105.1 MAG TPA: hypothetical protein [Caudoviricetes sp.]